MIARRLHSQLIDLLGEYPIVVLLGASQVGKTTLARSILSERDGIYLDLELASARSKLDDPENYLAAFGQQLVVLDEIQRQPELFQILRGLVDNDPQRTGRFLVLGSAGVDLLRQSGESLAGRIAYLELSPFDATEVTDHECLWLRGGFPKSFLASSDRHSSRWRKNFISTYLERDIPQLGPRIPTETLRRFWTMLAHTQGGVLNAAMLARSLGVSGKTISRYIDLLHDLLLIRKLEPWRANVGKRLTKAPKVYVRDSGVVHSLLDLHDRNSLLGHPVMGTSWEGFVIENILALASHNSRACFYRSVSGAEIDLVLTLSGLKPWAIEIKRSLAAKPSKGFHYACEDVQPAAKIVVYPGEESFPSRHATEVISLKELLARIASHLGRPSDF
ncbi:MAG: ATP-binding protein [Pseudomonadota bacterium]|nr:ATP-binding protein [Pseudomonadota bacterium]